MLTLPLCYSHPEMKLIPPPRLTGTGRTCDYPDQQNGVKMAGTGTSDPRT